MIDCFTIIHVQDRPKIHKLGYETSYAIGLKEDSHEVTILLTGNNTDIKSVMNTLKNKLADAGLYAEKAWFYNHYNVYCRHDDINTIKTIVDALNTELNESNFVPAADNSWGCKIM